MDYHDIVFNKIDLTNVDEYGRLTNPSKKYHLYNGPYFKKDTKEEHDEYINDLRNKIKNGEIKDDSKTMLVVYKGTIVGACSWYWRSKETNWLEVGIVIFEDSNWGRGIGTIAFSKWIDKVFKEHDDIIRIGFTTWSGNIGMIKIAQKLGLEKEACYKKARIVNGKYYDSISYGILRENWRKLDT